MQNFEKLGTTVAQFVLLQQRISGFKPDLVLENAFIAIEAVATLFVATLRLRTASYQDGVYLHFSLPRRPL